uniref:Uncharacterized protein n=1 Tax=Ascaris lumbricoides TaxID=6252 RepID=A0A0M3IBK9_ASCLU
MGKPIGCLDSAMHDPFSVPPSKIDVCDVLLTSRCLQCKFYAARCPLSGTLMLAQLVATRVRIDSLYALRAGPLLCLPFICRCQIGASLHIQLEGPI